MSSNNNTTANTQTSAAGAAAVRLGNPNNRSLLEDVSSNDFSSTFLPDDHSSNPQAQKGGGKVNFADLTKTVMQQQPPPQQQQQQQPEQSTAGIVGVVGGLRGALKTVHSGRSLSSTGSTQPIVSNNHNDNKKLLLSEISDDNTSRTKKDPPGTNLTSVVVAADASNNNNNNKGTKGPSGPTDTTQPLPPVSPSKKKVLLPNVKKSPGNDLVSPRATLFAEKLAKHNKALKNRLALAQQTLAAQAQQQQQQQNNHNNDGLSAPLSVPDLSRNETPPGMMLPGVNTNRRFNVGDAVLIRNLQSRFTILVNKHGYPPNSETAMTAEERAGPYQYVLAKVLQVHFEEFVAYYTVRRADTGMEQRADVEFMEPVRTTRGYQAAQRAAAASSGAGGRGGGAGGGTDMDPNNPELSSNPNALGGGGGGGLGGDNRTDKKAISTMMDTCFAFFLPLLWLYDCFFFITFRCLLPLWIITFRCLKQQASLLLHGMEPYSCRVRWTFVNFVVICNVWYMFIDQARLAWFPPSADNVLATVNMVVWCVLVLELAFEIFVRPEGYRQLIISDKAFQPSTILFINAFHLVVETCSLIAFVPEFYCKVSDIECGARLPFSFYNAAYIGVTGPTSLELFWGRGFLALIRLRIFSLVRHWKNMWIANTFLNMNWKAGQGGCLSYIVPTTAGMDFSPDRRRLVTGGKVNSELEERMRDFRLANGSTIGTALMVTNSYRALAILFVVTGFFPMVVPLVGVYTNRVATSMTDQLQATNMVASDNLNTTCDYLLQSAHAFLLGVGAPDVLKNPGEPFILRMDLTPVRCPFQETDGSITRSICLEQLPALQEQQEQLAQVDPRIPIFERLCERWLAVSGTTSSEIGKSLGLRQGSVVMNEKTELGNFTFIVNNGDSVPIPTNYTVRVFYDQTYTIGTAAFGSVLLQAALLFMVLGGLSILRRDAEVLVLGPLRRMLKIVAQYAKNPLAQPKAPKKSSYSRRKASNRHSSAKDDSSISSSSDDDSDDDDDDVNASEALGSYETEQLITAVTKITDLMRKCWGVAGADIIATNLATGDGGLTEVFNATVPGKSVYALFGFAAINGFDYALRQLGGDVMILINDVAAVLHGEVFRWGFGDSGQCNKNLGSAFLMVFRIGLVSEVVQRLEQATDVVFSASANRNPSAQLKKRSITAAPEPVTVTPQNASIAYAKMKAAKLRGKAQRSIQRSVQAKAMSLSLQSLPGISIFTDRAVLGMLKSFAGIHRDHKILEWNADFRLGAGVGAFSVGMIYGMDAGWAVEGAVGSEYKIDATYLSPHVNMASRMMMASKQYGVIIMLSQDVQRLMSDVAQSKLRHLDTITVKGSSVKQNIYTYDARRKGVDFFLYSRSDEQADKDADEYSPSIWNKDQDLLKMRQHITDEFLREYRAGHKAYIAGNWPVAIKKLERANEIMVENALDEGYLEEEFEQLQKQAGEDFQAAAEELKLRNGDGPSQYLVSFMKSYGGKAPDNWEGWHPLTRK